MARIALASFKHDTDDMDFQIMFEDENLLKEPLLARGIEIVTIPWQDETADWAAFDAVIIRSTWDYHYHYAAFLAWLTRLEQAGVVMLNPYAMLRWNLDKVYLGTLDQYGIQILPTIFVEQGTQTNLASVMEAQGWSRAVVKPTVSAGGDNTWRFTRDEALSVQAQFEEQVSRQSVMVQKYAERIAQGEWSFHFFNGVYSHTVNKIPAEGEMFVHMHRGGTVENVQPASALIAQASNMVRAIQEATGALPLYARVDTVVEGDALTLMEVELVEPYLYMPFGGANVADRFADAIALRVNA